jgi:hypothetical protein
MDTGRGCPALTATWPVKQEFCHTLPMSARVAIRGRTDRGMRSDTVTGFSSSL